jgi:hypothetical protein
MPRLSHTLIWREPMFSLVAQGAKHVSLDDEVFDYGTGEYLITLVDLPVNCPHHESHEESSISWGRYRAATARGRESLD